MPVPPPDSTRRGSRGAPISTSPAAQARARTVARVGRTHASFSVHLSSIRVVLSPEEARDAATLVRALEEVRDAIARIYFYAVSDVEGRVLRPSSLLAMAIDELFGRGSDALIALRRRSFQRAEGVAADALEPLGKRTTLARNDEAILREHAALAIDEQAPREPLRGFGRALETLLAARAALAAELTRRARA